jgi:ATP-dependent Clp protease protease subunit
MAESSGGGATGGIFTRLHKTPEIKGSVSEIVTLPKVVLINKFTEDSAKQFYTDMAAAENTDQEIIPIIIDSFGGQVYTLLAMIDCVKASKKKIATISLSKSMSCGVVMLTCGDDGYRFCSPMSTILIHDVSSWTWGKVEEVKADAAETERCNKMIYQIMDRNCGHEDGYFQKLVHDRSHADWYLTAEEAKEHNLVNHIRIPRFEVSVSSETKLV